MAAPDANRVTGNDAVAFFVEVAAAAVLGIWGYRSGSGATAVLLAVAVPASAMVLWGLFAAPKARFDRFGSRLLVKVLVLGGAVVAGFRVLPMPWARALAVVVAVNTLLLYVGPFARRPDKGAG